MSLSDIHTRQSLMFDMYHMHVEMIYHQLSTFTHRVAYSMTADNEQTA
jgi:hypothetical protein